MKIHNLIKHPEDFPPVISGWFYSNDVFLLYRILTNYTDEKGETKWEFVMGMGKGFYNHKEKLWYGYYDDHKCRISDFFSETGGQKIDSVSELLEAGCPQSIIDQLKCCPNGWAYKIWPDDAVFRTEIVGWYELPTYDEFLSVDC